MSTRSRIGIEELDGTVRSVYCHFDGYCSGVGATLLKAYTDPQKIRDLVALGGLSSLDEEIGAPHPFPGDSGGGLAQLQALKNARWTTAYHRDRGEDLLIQRNKSRKEFAETSFNSWEEYTYLFVVSTGQWLYRRSKNKRFMKLTEKACKE